LSRSELDICDRASLRDLIDVCNPWAVINAAGYVRVDDAETDRGACHRINCIGASSLAMECGRRGIPLLTFSSDLVFGGGKSSAYVESDEPAPLNVYGWSKARAERSTLKLNDAGLVIRSSAFFGPWDESNFPFLALKALTSGIPFPAANDITVSPTYVPDLAGAAIDLLIDGARGIWHLANDAAVSWSHFARMAAERAEVPCDLLRAVPSAELGWSAPRPRYSALGTERGMSLPSLDDALDRWISAAPITQSPSAEVTT
jgi:dTDP-4-dehydrorhamnose reductase